MKQNRLNQVCSGGSTPSCWKISTSLLSVVKSKYFQHIKLICPAMVASNKGLTKMEYSLAIYNVTHSMHAKIC
jgi:hypothetical protein